MASVETKDRDSQLREGAEGNISPCQSSRDFSSIHSLLADDREDVGSRIRAIREERPRFDTQLIARHHRRVQHALGRVSDRHDAVAVYHAVVTDRVAMFTSKDTKGSDSRWEGDGARCPLLASIS